MIVWVKKEATGRPNDQRAEVLGVRIRKHLTFVDVEMCGDGYRQSIAPSEICGIELGPTEEEGGHYTLMFGRKLR